MSAGRAALLKALTWRVVATADTFLLSYLITGSIRWAGSIGLAEFATKFLLYYLHERAWSSRPQVGLAGASGAALRCR